MGGYAGFLLPLIVLAIFYIILIRPQQARQREIQDLIANLKMGDIVVTSGGIIGKIVQLNEKSLIIRSADKSNLEISRSAIVGKEAEL